MLFRNLTLFRFSPSVAGDLHGLALVLPNHPLREPGPLELATVGFVPPTPSSGDALAQASGSCIGFAVGVAARMLPTSVVNDALRASVSKIEDEQGRRVGGRERRRLREDVLTELLPRAFVQRTVTRGYVDTATGWLVIDTASRKTAELVLTELREALGSFPAVPLAPEKAVRLELTQALVTGDMKAGYALGDECELRDPVQTAGAVSINRRQDLAADEIAQHVHSGKQAFRLGLVFNDRLSFVLGEDLTVRKLRFADAVVDAALADAEDQATADAADFVLLTGEVGALLSSLATWFDIPRPGEGGA